MFRSTTIKVIFNVNFKTVRFNKVCIFWCMNIIDIFLSSHVMTEIEKAVENLCFKMSKGMKLHNCIVSNLKQISINWKMFVTQTRYCLRRRSVPIYIIGQQNQQMYLRHEFVTHVEKLLRVSATSVTISREVLQRPHYQRTDI